MIVSRVFESRQRKRKNISIVLSSQKRHPISGVFFDVKKRDSKRTNAKR